MASCFIQPSVSVGQRKSESKHSAKARSGHSAAIPHSNNSINNAVLIQERQFHLAVDVGKFNVLGVSSLIGGVAVVNQQFKARRPSTSMAVTSDTIPHARLPLAPAPFRTKPPSCNLCTDEVPHRLAWWCGCMPNPST
jgi:hypothetical protein